MSDLAPFLQTLRDRLTVSEVIRPHVKLIRKGKEYSGLCPFHKEKSPSFTVNDEKGFYHCFGCGAHGDIFDFVMHKQNMPFMDAVELLAQLLGLEVPKRQISSGPDSEQPKADASLYAVMEDACCWFQHQLTLAQGAPARTYFEKRGLQFHTIAQFRLGYAPDHGLQAALEQKGYTTKQLLEAGLIGRSEERESTYDRFRNRLMFPIWDTKGRVIAFGGRILKDGEPKYLNSPDTPLFAKGKTLYAYNLALPIARQEEESLIVVEGYMDVISMHQGGLKTAVAPLGTALTPEQMGLLWRGGGDPVLCFDGDSAGMRAAHRAALKGLETIKVGQTLKFCFLPTGSDPDSMMSQGQTKELQGFLNHSLPLVEVLWSIFIHKRSFSTPEQKAIARRDLGYLIKDIVDPDVRHFYREELNNRLQNIVEFKGKASNHSGKTISQQGRFARNMLKFSHSQAPFSAPLRVSSNKNELIHKILLATLLNHPTLVEDAAESLIQLCEEAGKYDELRQAILSIVAENPPLLAEDLQEQLRNQGFASVLAEVLTPQIYVVAPFAKETTAREEALAGWKEIWQGTIAKNNLTAEASRTAHAVRDQLDEETWERFKFLKNQVIAKKDEKKGV
jgi:DNA primase